MKTKEVRMNQVENFENFIQFEMDATQLITIRGGDGEPMTDPDPEPIILPQVG